MPAKNGGVAVLPELRRQLSFIPSLHLRHSGVIFGTVGLDGVGLLTVNELAAEWRVTRGHVYELVKAGVLPAVRVGRSLRIPEAAARAFITAGGWRKQRGAEAGRS